MILICNSLNHEGTTKVDDVKLYKQPSLRKDIFKPLKSQPTPSNVNVEFTFIICEFTHPFLGAFCFRRKPNLFLKTSFVLLGLTKMFHQNNLSYEIKDAYVVKLPNYLLLKLITVKN